jgi:hypothetical protein
MGALLESKKALQAIFDWHPAWLSGEDMRAFTLNQIGDFEKNAS